MMRGREGWKGRRGEKRGGGGGGGGDIHASSLARTEIDLKKKLRAWTFLIRRRRPLITLSVSKYQLHRLDKDHGSCQWQLLDQRASNCSWSRWN